MGPEDKGITGQACPGAHFVNRKGKAWAATIGKPGSSDGSPTAFPVPTQVAYGTVTAGSGSRVWKWCAC